MMSRSTGSTTRHTISCEHISPTSVSAYNFGRRLKTLKGLMQYEYVCRLWIEESQRFVLNPLHHMPGPNI